MVRQGYLLYCVPKGTFYFLFKLRLQLDSKFDCFFKLTFYFNLQLLFSNLFDFYFYGGVSPHAHFALQVRARGLGKMADRTTSEKVKSRNKNRPLIQRQKEQRQFNFVPVRLRFVLFIKPQTFMSMKL